MTDTPASVADSNIPTQPVVTEPINVNANTTPVQPTQFSPIPSDSGTLPTLPVTEPEQKTPDMTPTQPDLSVPQEASPVGTVSAVSPVSPVSPAVASEASGVLSQLSSEPSASVPTTPQTEPAVKQPMIIKASKLSNNALRVFVEEYLKGNNNDYKDTLEQVQTIDELIEKEELTEEQLINNPIGL